jgi:menaquinone-dependent protoporphyrinogen oxidase
MCDVLCDVPVFYATTEGQTRRIAERIAGILRAQGFDSLPIDIDSPEPPRIDWQYVQGAFLGASVHAGRHQKPAEAFARAHSAELNARPSAFFSVSLSAASTNPQERTAARHLAEAFTKAARWQPTWTVCFAGRLAYTRYGFLKRLIMRWIAKREGGSTDTSRDHELTDWSAVATFANEMADAIRQSEPVDPVRQYETVAMVASV